MKEPEHIPEGPEDIQYEEESETPDIVKKLRERLASCEKEKEEYLTGWQRAKADYVNFKREVESSRAHERKAAHAEVLRDLLSVLDSFELAFSQKEAWEKTDPVWRKGIEGIHKEFLSVLSKHRLESFRPLGEEFDPTRQEAIGSKPVAAEQADTVVEVVQPGYTLGDSVIRPAKVIVGKAQTTL